jgi:hypothetical protein
MMHEDKDQQINTEAFFFFIKEKGGGCSHISTALEDKAATSTATHNMRWVPENTKWKTGFSHLFKTLPFQS